MTFAFYTLGCKVNQYETQALTEQLESVGFSAVSLEDNPKYIIVNSCTVTAESNRKTRQAVRRFKTANPDSCIVLIGCYPQAFPEEMQNFLEADIVLGNTTYTEFASYMLDFENEKARKVHIPEHTKGEVFDTPIINSFKDKTRAEIKIQDGCNRFCSYCIIPKSRGRIRSKSPELIKKEACSLAAGGYKEIVLVGINLSAYGQDNGYSLADAVEVLNEINGIERIRLGSLEFDQIDDSVLDRLSACSKFCPQFHLSLQSGCDRILKAMNRHYTTADYTSFVNKLYQKFDNPSITTDIIVGFPSESEAEFLETVRFVEKTGFAKVHAFPYSKRAGTKAAEMSGQLTASVKRQRCRRLIKAAKESEFLFMESNIGKTAEVLFESFKDGYYEGYTKNYLRIKAISPTDICGEIHAVKITSVENDLCSAKII